MTRRAFALAAAGGMACVSCGSNAPSAASGEPPGQAATDASGAPGEGDAGAGAGDGGPAADAASLPADGGAPACPVDDTGLPAEPTIPAACTVLTATRAVAPGTVPDETSLDTATIQAALDGCPSGQAVELTSGGAGDAFVTGPLRIPSGVTLWIDAGTTLFASRAPSAYGATCGTSGGSCTPVITVAGADQAIVGDGVIDGQGGEPLVGQTQSWWDTNAATNGAAAIPTLVRVSGATRFTLYRITLHNAPKFHVALGAKGFVVWGVTIKTPSSATNSQGTALTASKAHNTDGIDPGEAASDGYILYSSISDGDDQIAIKGGTGVSNLTIAHDHFGAGHGMSIGSETSGGVSGVRVYDLSIDGTVANMGGGASNGIRIKSDPSSGGLVQNVVYCDVCVRGLVNPIILTPHYTSATGTLIPEYTGIAIRNFRSMAGSATPTVTLDGYDATHVLGITLDNVTVDGITPANVKAAYADVTIGPGAVNFSPTGTSVTLTNGASGAATPNDCTGKWVTF
ncbi:MAG TPA: glycosyl hydrolase family 28 protein [Polyangiaceae bacterium]|nr:glycosyl hydrolase family 28 protein [Polyangiaceae bacterium]